jgi:tetratricopeptide (TPR) repeat protein
MRLLNNWSFVIDIGGNMGFFDFLKKTSRMLNDGENLMNQDSSDNRSNKETVTIKKLQDDFSYHSELIIEAENSNDAERIGFIAYCLLTVGNMVPGSRYIQKAVAIKQGNPLPLEQLKKITKLMSSSFSSKYKDMAEKFNKMNPSTKDMNGWLKMEDYYLSKYKYSSVLYMSLGYIYICKKMFDKALNYLDKAQFLDPYNSMLYNNYGMLYELMGKIKAAGGYYEKALSLDSNNQAARINLDLLSKKDDDHHDIQQDVEKNETAKCVILVLGQEDVNDTFIDSIFDSLGPESDNFTKFSVVPVLPYGGVDDYENDIKKYGNSLVFNESVRKLYASSLTDHIGTIAQLTNIEHGRSLMTVFNVAKQNNISLNFINACEIRSVIKNSVRCIIIKAY